MNFPHHTPRPKTKEYSAEYAFKNRDLPGIEKIPTVKGMEQQLDLHRPNIFEYENHRLFLKAYFDYCKQKMPQFSYRYFASKAGFTSPNFLKLVIDGKRNLSPASIEAFAKAFKLSVSESEYFACLVHFHQSETEAGKASWAQNILKCKGLQKIHPLRQAEYAYYGRWYYIPIREMLLFKNFKNDPQWIADQFTPPLKREQVTEALTHLEQIGLIAKSSDTWVQVQKTVSTGNEVSHSLVKQYHREMIQKGSDAIEQVQKLQREVSAICIPISVLKRDEIKLKIQQFRKEILALADNSEGAEEVYQLNIQWFPLVGKKEEIS